MNEHHSQLNGRVSALKRRWQLRDSSGYDHPGKLDGPTRIQGEIAYTRGVGPEHIAGLLDPSLTNHMPDPSILIDMDVAANRLAYAIMNAEPILIFGDYDVDGATSTAIMQRFLKSVDVSSLITHVPDRDNGYGFGQANFNAAANEFPELIVLLDCGTQNHHTIEEARNFGIDVIVVDHHQPSATLPSALAIVNPHRSDESEEGQRLRNLCTAGLAFMLAVATNRALRNAGWFETRQAPNLSHLLDLVALGTVCDVMKLTGLNRSFVSLGLKRLDRRDNEGMKALAHVAGVKEGATATALGFHLGPRINAGGRIGKARLGADLLASDDPVFCAETASELNRLNHERRDIENQVLQEALEQVDPADSVIIVAKKGWHHGVIGIVAGRLKETYNRPVIVIGIDEDDVGKGSGRSIVGVDLGRAIMDAVIDEKLVGGGGHVMACGLTIDPSKLDEFRTYMRDKIGAAASEARDANATLLDRFVFTTDLTPGFVEELEQMGPYGQGWPKPRFILGPARIDALKELNGGHAKFQIIDENGSIDGMAFRAEDNGLMEALLSDQPMLFAGQVEINTWRGQTRMQFMVEDIIILEPGTAHRSRFNQEADLIQVGQ